MIKKQPLSFFSSSLSNVSPLVSFPNFPPLKDCQSPSLLSQQSYEEQLAEHHPLLLCHLHKGSHTCRQTLHLHLAAWRPSRTASRVSEESCSGSTSCARREEVCNSPGQWVGERTPPPPLLLREEWPPNWIPCVGSTMDPGVTQSPIIRALLTGKFPPPMAVLLPTVD